MPPSWDIWFMMGIQMMPQSTTKPVAMAPQPGSSRLSSRYSLGSPSPSPSSSTPSPPLIHEEMNHSQSSQQRVSHKYSRDAVDHGIDLKADDISHLPEQVINFPYLDISG